MTASTYVYKNREIRTDLTFSVQLKNCSKEANLPVSIDHKTQKSPHKTKLQLLDYQNIMYQSGIKQPILTIVIYNGKKIQY